MDPNPVAVKMAGLTTALSVCTYSAQARLMIPQLLWLPVREKLGQL